MCNLVKKCQESKSSTQRKLGKLRPFPPAERNREEISMDFIFNLPKTKDNKKAILVVVDKLSKRAHFIPLPAEHKAEDTAKVFYNEVYKPHGLPSKIISDKDVRFTAAFWKELMRLLQIRSNRILKRMDSQRDRSEHCKKCYDALSITHKRTGVNISRVSNLHSRIT